MATRGERIKQLMKENKISAKELAEYIQATVGHISVGYIYKIMRDEVESPNIEILKAIAKKLDTDLNYLEGERDNILYLTEPVIPNTTYPIKITSVVVCPALKQKIKKE